ncbi:hypothetical protein ABZT17_28320 [Streptomyces sp. NPDC005648]|uniref:hypothetical protein n=1 Tax=Streptomyces sp. NPDC005648 TaxID=3157044 RepID=UPI0033BB261E
MTETHGVDAAETAARTAAAQALRELHGTRARSAYERALAACRRAGVDESAAQAVPDSPVGRAAHALRLAGRSLAALTTSAPDPAADARCARNAAATAALAAQLAQTREEGEGAREALGAALAASRAAAVAAGGAAAGKDTALNAAADEAEKLAVAAAREAGWR